MSKTFWDRFAFAYDFFQNFNKKAYQATLAEITQLIHQDMKVLECAAGTGIISIAIAPKVKNVLCTDLSLPMLEKAKKKAEKQNINNIAFDERTIFHLSNNDETFDVSRLS